MNRQQFIAASCAIIFSAGDGIVSSACPPQQSAKLVDPEDAEYNYFGYDVAWAGGTLLIGSFQADIAAPDAGAVYMYDLVGGAWTLSQTLVPDDAIASQSFGSALAIDPDDPDTLFIGSSRDDAIANLQGSVYVFTRGEDGAWTQVQKLIPTDIQLDQPAGFGSSLAIDGDTLLIGSPLENNDTCSLCGAAYVFQRDKAGLWTQQQRILPQEFVTPSGAVFGASVDVQGDRAIIGAPYLANEFIFGWVEVHARIDGIWTQEQRFHGAIATGRDRFGASVKLMGDVAIVGSPRTPPPPAGLVYTFQRTLDRFGQPDWVSQQTLTASDPSYYDQFGCSIAVHDSTVVIGAQQPMETGAAYVHDISGPQLKSRDKLTADDGLDFDLFGSQVAINGQHIAVSAMFCDQNSLDAGAVYVFDLQMLGDITGNCIVDVDDLLELINAWGPCGNPCPEDLTGNGVVDVDDLLAVINNWS